MEDVAGADVVGIDAPFGWPEPFFKAAQAPRLCQVRLVLAVRRRWERHRSTRCRRFPLVPPRSPAEIRLAGADVNDVFAITKSNGVIIRDCGLGSVGTNRGTAGCNAQPDSRGNYW
jgi:hypothetical protein